MTMNKCLELKSFDTANTINTGMNLGMDIVNQKAEVES